MMSPLPVFCELNACRTSDPHRLEPLSRLKTKLAGFSSGRAMCGLIMVRFFLVCGSVLSRPTTSGTQNYNLFFAVLALVNSPRP